jgi:tRNA(fMet)-specific endonuclease VapC
MTETILLDTSILIDFFRKEKKENSILFKISKEYQNFAVSVITEYEIFVGCNETQKQFWEVFFQKINIIPLDSKIDIKLLKLAMD